MSVEDQDLADQAALAQTLLASVLHAEVLVLAEPGIVVRVTLTQAAHAYAIPMLLRSLRSKIKDVSLPGDAGKPLVVTFANESQIEFVKGAGL